MNFEAAENSEGRENKISRSPDEPKLDVAQNDHISEETVERIGVGGNTKHTLRMDIVLTSEVCPEKECEAYEARMQSALSLGKGLEELPSSVEKESKNDVDVGPSANCPLEKLESSDENDLSALLCENACCATTKIVALGSADEFGDNSQQDGRTLCEEKSLEVNLSPTNSRIQRYQMKGKAKALSDGNVNGRVPDEEDDSHESVESCNTTRLVSTGKRRCSFEQQLTVGSKRVKGKIHENPYSTSFVKQDSSFTNWISNILRGFTKSKENEAPSTAHTLEVLNSGHGSPHQNSIACNRNHDPWCRDSGFQSIFHSLYCPMTGAQEVNNLNANYQTDGPKDLKLDIDPRNIHATPIACRTVTGSFYKRFQLLSGKLNESASGYGTGSMPKPKHTCMINPSIQEICRSGSMEKKNSRKYFPGEERKGTSSNSCLGKHNKDSGEKVDSKSLSEGKTTNIFVDKLDPLASLWVTRFTSKSYSPSSNQGLCYKSNGEALDSSIDGMKLKSQLSNYVSSDDDQKIMKGRKHSATEPLHMQTFATSAEYPFGFLNTKSQHDEKSICNMEPILPSPQFKKSELMASIFARRLDALKQIIPLDITNNAACASWTCFFCGLKGHNLRNCPKVSCSELEDVLWNISSYIGTEELPSLCIRCFQPDHWAVACPNASPSMRYEVVHGYSVVDECAHNNPQLGATNQYNAKMTDGRDGQLQAAVAATDFDGNDPGMSIDSNFKCKSDEAASSEKLEGNADLFEKGIASSCIQNKFKENKIMHLCDFSNKHILNVPKGIFDTLKMLQLSRTDILKWMKSCLPLSHLDGFFLRMRVRKWEEGLQGTRYCVACITGVQKESFIQKSENSIAVTIGRIKSTVESKCISNHYLLEDELMAWWSATSKAGIGLPSEEYLRRKVKEKQMLGLRTTI
uniref:Uncharacterized protein LOC105129485 isoform X1 n=2 Tax=Rhizophora mucronata TaxID=61149 RepID=A0A2P2LGL0_RHIMU